MKNKIVVNQFTKIKNSFVLCIYTLGSFGCSQLRNNRGSYMGNFRSRQNAEIKNPTSQHLIWAVQQSNMKKVLDLIHAQVNLNAQDRNGYTPLNLALTLGFIKIAKALIDAGANLNPIAFYECSPLSLAIKIGNIEVMKALIDAGADPNTKGWKDGYTPLHLAVKLGNIEAMLTLIDAGTNLNAKNWNGETPLHLAVKLSNIEAVRTLRSAGNALTTLNQKEIDKLFIQSDFSVNKQNKIVACLIIACTLPNRNIVDIENHRSLYGTLIKPRLVRGSTTPYQPKKAPSTISRPDKIKKKGIQLYQGIKKLQLT